MTEWTTEQVAADPLAASQTIADLRFALKQARDQRDLLEVKASQLMHLLEDRGTAHVM